MKELARGGMQSKSRAPVRSDADATPHHSKPPHIDSRRSSTTVATARSIFPVQQLVALGNTFRLTRALSIWRREPTLCNVDTYAFAALRRLCEKMRDVAKRTTLLTGLAGLLAGACAMQAKGPADSTASSSHRPEGENHVTQMPTASGFAEINSARIYYEVAGQGPPFVMLHAGVADSRQWNEELRHFSQEFRVLRYDMRGYGKSEPVAGDFNHLDDLTKLLDLLKIEQPVIVMGCSMGGGIAMDFALERPSRVRAVIMVGSAPTGLELEARTPAKFEQVEAAYSSGDYDRVAELKTQIWFDGEGRSPDQVDPHMRRLAYDMSRLVLRHEAKQLGNRLPNTVSPAAKRSSELTQPLLVIAGEHDTPYIRAAAGYMANNIPSARLQMMADAAHLPNMDHPQEFQRLVASFLSTLKP